MAFLRTLFFLAYAYSEVLLRPLYCYHHIWCGPTSNTMGVSKRGSWSYCLHPGAASSIKGKCLTQKMHLKKPFQLITSASVAHTSWVLPCCYDPKCTHLCPTWLAAKAAWGRQDLGLSLFPSTTRAFQVFLKSLMIDLGILYHA